MYQSSKFPGKTPNTTTQNHLLTKRTFLRTLGFLENPMTTCNATEARTKLYSLIDETTSTHKPITITGKRGNAVLLSEGDWNAINETVFLLSIPGMRESIREGMDSTLDDASTELDW